MARMRYPAQALELLKELDPDTCVTLNYIRTLVAKGVIPCVKVGRGRLINVDKLIEYLAAGDAREQATESGSIRQVKA